MKGMMASLDKLRADAAEAALVRDLATDRQKQELFKTEHYTTLVTGVERAIADGAADKDQRRARFSVSAHIEETLVFRCALLHRHQVANHHLLIDRAEYPTYRQGGPCGPA